MRIDDFLSHEDPDDHYESLGVPPVPAELTRREILRYRTRVQRYLEKMQAQLNDSTPPMISMRLSRIAGKRAVRNSNAALGRRFSRRSYYRNAEPFVSATKTKAMREHNASQRGRPYHMREQLPEQDARNVVRECRDVAISLLKEIERRFPNLPAEKPVERKRPVVAPTIDEFYE